MIAAESDAVEAYPVPSPGNRWSILSDGPTDIDLRWIARYRPIAVLCPTNQCIATIYDPTRAFGTAAATGPRARRRLQVAAQTAEGDISWLNAKPTMMPMIPRADSPHGR